MDYRIYLTIKGETSAMSNLIFKGFSRGRRKSRYSVALTKPASRTFIRRDSEEMPFITLRDKDKIDALNRFADFIEYVHSQDINAAFECLLETEYGETVDTYFYRPKKKRRCVIM